LDKAVASRKAVDAFFSTVYQVLLTYSEKSAKRTYSIASGIARRESAEALPTLKASHFGGRASFRDGATWVADVVGRVPDAVESVAFSDKIRCRFHFYWLLTTGYWLLVS
jgi:hypothetical protein